MRDPGISGLKGIDPDTATPEEKLQFGKDYFNALKAKYNGDERAAVTAYHMGMGAYDSGREPGPATQAYVIKVLGQAPVAKPVVEPQDLPITVGPSVKEPVETAPTPTIMEKLGELTTSFQESIKGFSNVEGGGIDDLESSEQEVNKSIQALASLIPNTSQADAKLGKLIDDIKAMTITPVRQGVTEQMKEAKTRSKPTPREGNPELEKNVKEFIENPLKGIPVRGPGGFTEVVKGISGLPRVSKNAIVEALESIPKSGQGKFSGKDLFKDDGKFRDEVMSQFSNPQETLELLNEASGPGGVTEIFKFATGPQPGPGGVSAMVDMMVNILPELDTEQDRVDLLDLLQEGIRQQMEDIKGNKVPRNQREGNFSGGSGDTELEGGAAADIFQEVVELVGPGADIQDTVAASARTTEAVKSGDIRGVAVGTGEMLAGLAGVLIPGSQKIKAAGKKVGEFTDETLSKFLDGVEETAKNSNDPAPVRFFKQNLERLFETVDSRVNRMPEGEPTEYFKLLAKQKISEAAEKGDLGVKPSSMRAITSRKKVFDEVWNGLEVPKPKSAQGVGDTLSKIKGSQATSKEALDRLIKDTSQTLKKDKTVDLQKLKELKDLIDDI